MDAEFRVGLGGGGVGCCVFGVGRWVGGAQAPNLSPVRGELSNILARKSWQAVSATAGRQAMAIRCQLSGTDCKVLGFTGRFRVLVCQI